MQAITVQELRDVLHREPADEMLILDVRTRSEYRNEHIIGVANIPLDEIERHTDELSKYKHIYIHCNSGSRSTQACQQLARLGMANMVNVQGGIQEWKNAGFPVNKSERFVLPIMQQVQIVAGSLVVLGALLALLLNPLFVLLSLFVGGGLVFAGFSGTCTMGLILSRMPWNRA